MEIKKYEIYVREISKMDFYSQYFSDADDVYRFATEKLRMHELDREHVVAISVDSKGKVIGVTDESIGGLNSAMFCPREILKFLILGNAAGVFLLHNHPSGDVNPSINDIAVTEKLKKALEPFDISLVDHLIVSREGFTSLKERGHC